MLKEKEQQTQLETFAKQLPSKPYCADDLEYGLVIRQARQAILKKHIQHNKPTSVHWLAFDCDYPNAIEKIQGSLLPVPNIAVLNKANGHSHLLYGLQVPVHRSDVARAKPLNFLAKVEFALREALHADNGYAGLIVKNPLHKDWLTYELRRNSYDLPELADWLTLPSNLPPRAESIGLGRNCTLFERLRRWAYREVLNYRLTATYEAFKDAVLIQAIALNNFPQALPQSEIRSTATSVAKWTWKKYTGRVSDAEWQKYVADTHTPEIQAKRGYKGGKAGGRGRTSQDEQNRATARLMKSKGYTYQAISQNIKVPLSTVGRWCK